MENQVCSLELSKLLEKLGVKQNSYFYWVYTYKEKYNLFHAENDDCNQHNGPGDITWLNIKKRSNQAWSAFTVAELGYLLPKQIEIIIDVDKNGYGIFRPSLWCGRCEFTGDNRYEWMISYGDDHFVLDENEANARAKMLIYLIENNLWKKETK